jgi:hypothetical protein
MYSTCMFCNASLGSNEVIEAFPVGRRLAFDAARGRLWVVCRKCERWNLSPLEERWEAVEECERLFRDTHIRVSTEHIGLARVPEGLELVRIGDPLRPELAAWRYGDQFGRRRKRALIYGVAGVVLVGGVVASGVAAGVIGSSVLAQSGNFVNLWTNGRVLARVRTEDGKVLKLKRRDLSRTRLVVGDEGMEFMVPRRSEEHRFTGEEAQRVAGVVVSRINRNGARASEVQDAVRLLDARGTPEAVLREAASHITPTRGLARRRGVRNREGQVASLPAPARLAVEMALHEEQERRALEGELWRLQQAWEEAEEIAEISDSLLLPEGTEAFLEGNRGSEDA